MKLSDSTLSLLKNFSTINQSILFKQGNKLRTISVMKNILAETTISEELPRDFGIYDLGQFLNGLSLHNNPDLDFQEDSYVVIKEGRSRSKYFFADPQVIVTPPDKTFTLPSEDVTFDLSTEQLDKLLKAAAIYQLPDLAVVGANGVVKIVVRDKKNDTSNDFAITVEKIVSYVKDKWQTFGVSALLILILQLLSSKILTAVLLGLVVAALLPSDTIKKVTKKVTKTE